MANTSKWGIFIGDSPTKEYEHDEYDKAIRDLNRLHMELGFKCELKRIIE